MQLPDLDALGDALKTVYKIMIPTPQIEWSLRSERCGCEVLFRRGLSQ